MSTTTFVVFDDVSLLRQSLPRLDQADNILLVPLTSDHDSIRAGNGSVAAVKPEARVVVADLTAAVSIQVDRLRGRMPAWAHDLGETLIGDRSVRETFLTSDDRMSTWWMSHISERHPSKIGFFLQAAQAQAVAELIDAGDVSLVLLAIEDSTFERCLANMIADRGVPVVAAATTRPRRRRVARTVVRAILVLTGKTLWTTFIRLALAGRRRRLNGDVLFFSYFPRLDVEAARQGTLINRLASPLQPLFDGARLRIDWVWIWVRSFEPRSARAVFSIIRSLRRGGHSNILLEQKFDARSLVVVARNYMRQVMAYRRVRKRLNSASLVEGLSPEPRVGELLWKWLEDSFIGPRAVKNLFFYALFDALYRTLPPHRESIYYLEMQPWEAALNAARAGRGGGRTIGFLHTSVPPNYFPFFVDSRDAGDTRPDALPLPDVVACNGEIPLEMMRPLGLPSLREVEAIRHLGAETTGDAPHYQPSVLFVGTLIQPENSALISMMKDAFGDNPPFQVLVREHPALPLSHTLKRYGVSGHEMAADDLADVLARVQAVVVGSSTVAVDALARGIPVITPRFVDVISMSSLEGTGGVCDWVTTPAELRAAVEGILAAGESDLDARRKQGREFAERCWWTDPALPRWRELLLEER